ncbi:putative glycolipid-binding domain-containing protein [Microvirga sp. ACRRW]|uniref:putative glycolipid-binding domain-containing protein n=1 Tax=Microvirga sp. ACRRW TaxID=2918205 RepID=UPI001EF4C9D1|nr:putative glycolipid-binding domain-containing protein [Microvirga sp. ACRRW]MCG7392193.1 putative glycolipid-binding domain-containing protein [Microvirga sp. ACRRW]
MSSRPLIFRTIRWSAWDGCEAGLEQVDIRPADGGLAISGVVIGKEEEAKFGLHYRLRVDSSWRTRSVHLQTTAGHVLDLESNGQGAWIENGKPRPELQGCIDVDIQATPLTNTLPIRRLEWQAGQSTDIRLCYIAMPDLSVSARDQRYTAIEPGSLYRFESLESGFTADLPVDEDGFVRDYPELFRRLA